MQYLAYLATATSFAITSAAASFAWSHDVCQTQYTRMHYAQSKCFEVPRPLKAGSNESFKIRSVLVTKDLAMAAGKPTVVIVPGGPGESSEPLKTELQKKDFINGMWGPMGVNVVLFDPRGTGMSKFPQDTTSYDGSVLSTLNQVDDLKAVIDTIEPNRPVYLFAHSAGGHIALAFAEKYPKSLAGMLLLSASSSPREMAQLNLATYGRDSSYWSEFEKLFPAGDQAALKEKYLNVEDVLVQQLKARILKKFVHPNLKPISPIDFRANLLRRMQSDKTGKSVREHIESYAAIFQQMNEEGPLLVPSELRQLKLTENDLSQFSYSAKEWIQLNIMCGEGLLAEENDLPTVYDGVSMRRFCKDLHIQGSIVEPDVAHIKTPVVLVNGEDDTQVPNYISRRLASRLPHSRLIVAPGAGHVFVDKKPMVLYNALESLVRGVQVSHY